VEGKLGRPNAEADESEGIPRKIALSLCCVFLRNDVAELMVVTVAVVL